MPVVHVCPLCGDPPKAYADEGHYYIECDACTAGREADGYWMTHELYDFLTRPGHPFQTVRKRIAPLLDQNIGKSKMRPIAARHAEELMSAG
ncbi:MAG: hypothetical protein ACYTKD_29910 [Planctomycetota bacterium]|jgi:hypothetical protein